MEIIFVLTEPETPQNVGSCARALRTMGFGTLRLVNPCSHLCERARALACDAADLLETAEVFQTLPQALADTDLVIGTTSRIRRRKTPWVESRLLVDEILLPRLHTSHRVALVFGRESTGLSAEELKTCHIVTSVALAQPQPSLNLAQTVMIYAYELARLRQFSAPSPRNTSLRDGGPGAIATLRKKAAAVLLAAGIPEGASAAQKVRDRLALLNPQDVALSHYLCDRLLTTISAPLHTNKPKTSKIGS